MVNQLKIITMTQLALYDKHEGPADRIANDYFRHDFIYRNNLGTRLAVGLGGILVLVIYWLQALFINEMDLFEINIQQYVTDSIFFILAILAVYSLVGTIQGTRQYYLVQKRLAQYQALVRQLERLEERSRRVYDNEEAAEPHAYEATEPPGYENTAPRVHEKTTPPRRNPSPPVRTAPPIEHTRPIKRQPSFQEHTRPIRPLPPERTRPQRTEPLPVRTRPPSTQPPLPPGHARPLRPRPQPTAPIEHTRIPRPKDAEPKG